jgi:chloramphenicol 3-O-phosphotransferase
MKSIAFCGKIAAGKTYISQNLSSRYFGRVESIATPLKKFAQEILDTIQDGLSDNYKKVRKPEHRNLLALIGNRLRDPEFNHPRFWVNKVNTSGNQPIFVDDMRYPSEEHYLRSKGFLIVKLNTSDEEQERRALERDGAFNPSIRDHYSELAHKEINCDIVIDVDGKTAQQIIDELTKKITFKVKVKSFLLKIWYSLVLQIKGN